MKKLVTESAVVSGISQKKIGERTIIAIKKGETSYVKKGVATYQK